MTEASTTTHEQPGLFASAGGEQPAQTHDQESLSPVSPDVAAREAVDERAARTRNSMLWAAYGDALGFISELVDQNGLERRTQGAPLDHLMAWERRVGGKWGVDVRLPAGCWSDDTQLRMAVGRSISCFSFDVETFARIELPVWLSYALGGGRASKAAAKNLGKPRTLWYANTFPGWADAGGNGAAMRIQPHVWASRDLRDDYMLGVVADSVCTHGHPRAIVGACFHAATLAHCLSTGTVPDSDACMDIAARVRDTIRLIEEHAILGSTWTGLWEQATGEQFNNVWRRTIDELCAAIEAATDRMEAADGVDTAYAAVVARLGLRAAEQRGSGILTTVAAAALAAAVSKAHDGVVAAANAIGTDTDTIATMAGALLGACDGTADPPEEPLDGTYLRREADRLIAVSRGERTDNHTYPDLLTWCAPQTQADALVGDNGSLAVEGLGPATPREAGAIYTARQDFAWAWVETYFGQTLLIKRRPEVRPLEADNDLIPPPAPASKPWHRGSRKRQPQNQDVLEDRPITPGVNLSDALDYVRQHLDDDSALGYTLRRVARDGSRGDLLNFAKEIHGDLRR